MGVALGLQGHPFFGHSHRVWHTLRGAYYDSPPKGDV